MSKVSIIMPTYKRQVPMISRAVESVLGQDYDNIELVVVDDSPQDYPTREKVKDYLESLEDTRIRYIRNEENLGGALARNEGIKGAEGDYITFLDDDDMYMAEKVGRQVHFMEDKGYDMTFQNLVLKNEDDKVIDVREFHFIESLDNEDLLKYHIMHHLTGTPTFMYRAEKIKEIGGFDDAIMGQEFYLMLKTIESGMKIGYLDAYDVVAYRHSGESISNGMNKIKGQKILQEKKEEYYHLFDNRQKRYISLRNRAVLSVAYFRNGMVGDGLKEGLAAFLYDPFQFTAAAIKFTAGVLKFR